VPTTLYGHPDCPTQPSAWAADADPSTAQTATSALILKLLLKVT
jgi:hypothetical protein